MNDIKTAADFVKESGLSAPAVNALLKDVTPEIVLGRSKGYHPDALRAALINKHGSLLAYLGLTEIAANSLKGFGADNS